MPLVNKRLTLCMIARQLALIRWQRIAVIRQLSFVIDTVHLYINQIQSRSSLFFYQFTISNYHLIELIK